jgi:hypothetical protein
MITQNYLDRPGIHVVDDAHELNSIAGGASNSTNSTLGDAELDAFLETKWISRVSLLLTAFYLYGNPAHRARVQSTCLQLARGVNNVRRDSLNIIYRGIGAAAALPSWIKSYFTAAADSTATTPVRVCPDPPDDR